VEEIKIINQHGQITQHTNLQQKQAIYINYLLYIPRERLQFLTGMWCGIHGNSTVYKEQLYFVKVPQVV